TMQWQTVIGLVCSNIFHNSKFLCKKTISMYIGVVNSIPIFWNKSSQELPETGWGWALEKGFQDKKAGRKPNMLVGL
ncbi:MAG: hypothetical protein SVM86_07305, partial [Candidatus Cloacimonadota bacterium]|nr:hypothetical protein [Candidatus Cloacimonadota bacterium]